ncbi:hypothetical protein HHK36_019762 [Tetracentron sinense]|uniref:Glyoxalase/fosfomycin resistance/dioxygenase domain-containing protein n=1 Tax=Tetracentron sinense TaxID=13715 RepID=A0A835D9F1_TETSI|nr:hypothetical protein HHK36_019762 [Tetracentron sinense]
MVLNHVSRLCRSVNDSIDFYVKVLGFVLIERPQAFHFNGAWLFNYGVGIHLVQSKEEERLPVTDHLDPLDNHISFQLNQLVSTRVRTVQALILRLGSDHISFGSNPWMIRMKNYHMNSSNYFDAQ